MSELVTDKEAGELGLLGKNNADFLARKENRARIRFEVRMKADRVSDLILGEVESLLDELAAQGKEQPVIHSQSPEFRALFWKAVDQVRRGESV